jgi:FkbM family methyltransferase
MRFTHTPLRQMARLYASVLALPPSLSALAERSASLPTRDDVAHAAARIDAALQRLTDATSTARTPAPAPPPAAAPPSDPAQPRVHERAGFKLMLDPTSLVDRCMIDAGMWEPEQTSFLMRLIRAQRRARDPVFLDIGSYWGLYSLLAMREGVRRIHAFEADRHNHAQLQAQLFLNDAVGRITAHHRAVSSKAGVLNCWDSRCHPDGNRGGVGIWGAGDPTHPTFEVPSVAIDEHLPLRDEFIFVKLDVEGHESHALEGMRRTIRNNRVVMQIELFAKDEAVMLPLTEELGLRCFHRIDVDRYFTNASDTELAPA